MRTRQRWLQTMAIVAGCATVAVLALCTGGGVPPASATATSTPSTSSAPSSSASPTTSTITSPIASPTVSPSPKS
jgi:hypothetical protein